MRSFMLPVGLAHSSLAITRPAPGGTTFFNSINGVFPIAERIFIIHLYYCLGLIQHKLVDEFQQRLNLMGDVFLNPARGHWQQPG